MTSSRSIKQFNFKLTQILTQRSIDVQSTLNGANISFFKLNFNLININFTNLFYKSMIWNIPKYPLNQSKFKLIDYFHMKSTFESAAMSEFGAEFNFSDLNLKSLDLTFSIFFTRA